MKLPHCAHCDGMLMINMNLITISRFCSMISVISKLQVFRRYWHSKIANFNPSYGYFHFHLDHMFKIFKKDRNFWTLNLNLCLVIAFRKSSKRLENINFGNVVKDKLLKISFTKNLKNGGKFVKLPHCAHCDGMLMIDLNLITISRFCSMISVISKLQVLTSSTAYSLILQ